MNKHAIFIILDDASFETYAIIQCTKLPVIRSVLSIPFYFKEQSYVLRDLTQTGVLLETFPEIYDEFFYYEILFYKNGILESLNKHFRNPVGFAYSILTSFHIVHVLY